MKRLITSHESDSQYLSNEKHAEIIYSNFIITIPMLFDLFTLYGYSNIGLIQKIMQTLIKIESKYSSDIKNGINFILSTFESMTKQLNVEKPEDSQFFVEIRDLIMYLMNIATTLNITVSNLPEEINIYCTQELHLEHRIAAFYDNFIPVLYQNACIKELDAVFLKFINYSRVELINCFRSSVYRGISSILDTHEKKKYKMAGDVLSTFIKSAGYKTFVTDYTKLYPIQVDLDIITQSGANM